MSFVAAICAASDAILIVAGVAGLGRLVQSAPGLLTFVSLAGAAFLFVYGAIAFRRALHPGQLLAAGTEETALGATVAACLAFTFLNPHVYLDTVVLIGAVSARYDSWSAIVFGAGAATASAVWFFGLGYGARLLSPIFAKPAAWRVLDILIGVIMWSIAARLAMEV